MSFTYAVQTAVRKADCETATQKCVMHALARLSNETGEVLRSTKIIANVARVCQDVVIKVLHQLATLKKIRILSQGNETGHYQILGLPTQADTKIDSFRMEIADAVRLLPLPPRVSRIFQAFAVYSSKNGNNIFPALETIQHDTKYSMKVVRETLRWLLLTGMMAEDADCINGKYQSRTGYKIPGWNALAGTLSISDEQIQQITLLHKQRNRRYYESRGDFAEASREQLVEDLGDDLAETLTNELAEPEKQEPAKDWGDDLAEAFAEPEPPKEDPAPAPHPAPFDELREQAYSRMQQYQRLLDDPTTNEFMRGLALRGVGTWREKYEQYCRTE